MDEDVPLKKRLLRYGEKAVKIGSDLADVLVHVKANPGPLTMLSVAAKALDSYREATAVPLDSFFGTWHLMQIGGLGEFLLTLFAQTGFIREQEDVESKEGKIYLGTVHGCELGWIKYETWAAGPYIRDASHRDRTLEAVGRALWEIMGPALALKNRPLRGEGLVPDQLSGFHESQTARDLWARLEKFVVAGHPRSVLLHGEPGVGKSHLMRYVSQLAGGYSLRLDAQTLEGMQNLTVAILMTKPDAVLIDDLDRIERPGAVLTEIDEARGAGKLLMCTVNRLNKLDPAALRVGRFDELVEITKLDDAVIDALIGDVPDAARETLRALPVAWIDEFHKIREVLGLEEALREITTLEKRTAHIRSLCADEDDDDKDDDKDDDEPPGVRLKG